MSVDLTVDVRYEGMGNKRIMISDLRDPFREVLNKAEKDGVPISFFKHIVKYMPGLGSLALARVVQKFDHYFAGYDRNGSEALVLDMKEIASMDPDLERRIVRKSVEMLDNFGGLVDAQHVSVGLNADKRYVVKLTYKTEVDNPAEYNTYDDEKRLRTTVSSDFDNKDQAMYHSMWLAGALNIRHIDEDEMP